MKICRVATVPFFVTHHLGRQILATAEAGHEVHVITSPLRHGEHVEQLPRIRYHFIQIARRIAPISDLRSLYRLWRCFRSARFDVVHSTTPKAGLLCALAGVLAGVPVRLHTFTGQAWREMHGPVRWIAKASDWLIVRLSTRCYADSPSQRDFLVEQGVGRHQDIAVLGPGSLAGVELRRFDFALKASNAALRVAMGIPPQVKVVTFIGRVTRDKGIAELVEAFEHVQETVERNAMLLLVGPLESTLDPLPPETLDSIGRNPAIRLMGYTGEPEKFLAITDLFCLPSYREGFGNGVIEAGAMGVPSVATQVTGPVDSIVHGETGLLVPPKSATALARALGQLLKDDVLRQQMGSAARRRSVEVFSAERINGLLIDEYDAIAAEAGVAVRAGARG